jgi:PAS domain S-box-containing protein
MPTPDMKPSGYGRELAGDGIREFVNIKSVSVTERPGGGGSDQQGRRRMPRISREFGRATRYQGLMDVCRYAGACCASEFAPSQHGNRTKRPWEQPLPRSGLGESSRWRYFVAESAEARSDVPLGTSIPAGAVPLESLLCTEDLHRRPSRPPDYEKENCALVKLMSALADSPSSVLQTLAETILVITQCDSAGLSLLTRDGKTPDVCGKRFYWPAIAGMWNPHVGDGTPRNFGPCGDVLDQNRTLLFRHFERRYPYLLPVIPAAEECLLVPFYVAGEAVGTIWAIMHSDRRQFDAEDDRVMASLGKFASSAYQALIHIEDLKFQVAKREQAEAEVRELARGLEAKIRRLVEANVVGIVMWNLEGAITGANDAFLRMVQYDREDLASGRVHWTDLTPAEWRGHDEQAVADLKATGIFQPFEKEYFRKDGSRVPVVLGGALFEESGNEGVAFVLDLSEQKRAARALRRSEAFLAEAQHLSQTGSFSWRVAADAITWSEQLYRIYELEIGVPVTLELIRTRVHPEDLSLIEKMVDQARGGRNDFEWQYRLMMPDHSIKYLHAVAHATHDQHGQLEYIAAVQDVTARRLSEEALDKARAQLTHVARVTSLGVLTASIAHELNQPLSGIITNANTCLRMLAADCPDIDGARETARRTIRDGNRASEVIARLRALFTNKEPTPELVDLNEATQEVIALSAGDLQRNQVIVRQELADDLPPVVGDRVQMQQVILNLLMNASDAMSGIDDRPRQLMISTARDDDDCLRVVVQDVGVGFDPETAARLFEAFYTTKSSGMGIGLSVSRSIIERHHGRIWGARNDGPGATFSFSIPRAPERLPEWAHVTRSARPNWNQATTASIASDSARTPLS